MSSIAECVRLATGILPTGAAMMLTSNVRTAVVAVLLFAVSATAAFAAEDHPMGGCAVPAKNLKFACEVTSLISTDRRRATSRSRVK